MKKKIFAIVLCVAMISIAVVGGTMAYFTDSVTVSNVMTTGNVKIEITETKLDGTTPFEASAITVVPSTNVVTVSDPTQINNFVDKGIWVENIGNTKAYVRTIILFEVPAEGTIAEKDGVDGYPFFKNKVHLTGNDNYTCAWDYVENATVEIDGSVYGIVVRTYETALAPNEKYEPLMGFAFGGDVTSEEAAATGETYEVLVLSQAVQKEGFDTAAAAFDATYGEVTAAKVTDWFKGD